MTTIKVHGFDEFENPHYNEEVSNGEPGYHILGVSYSMSVYEQSEGVGSWTASDDIGDYEFELNDEPVTRDALCEKFGEEFIEDIIQKIIEDAEEL